ncbi:unnamed protein product [Cyprideis torosa]|uniref:Kinesin-like protein n=1 Tax=Cyprideis torosa TaxID=163714 RepID=A0A7R8WI50_9CRUS|nr:unnamed protein product [Cyprideis torosa]CAG0897459.1 unnamed protein product [Cyprideis torosa]
MMSGTRRTPFKTPLKPPYKTPTRDRLETPSPDAFKDPVLVYCRIRPHDGPTSIKKVDDTTVRLEPPESNVGYDYRFAQVFGPDCTQEELFDVTTQESIKNLLNGKNSLMYTYGVSGSGKTFTVTGTNDNIGLVPRSLDVLFNSLRDLNQLPRCQLKPDGANGYVIVSEVEAEKDRIFLEKNWFMKNRKQQQQQTQIEDGEDQIILDVDLSLGHIEDNSAVHVDNPGNGFAVFVSYLEVYNNSIFDLLDSKFNDPIRRTFTVKNLRDDPARGVYVQDMTQIHVKSAAEALMLLTKGQKRRKVAHTALNAVSSRSHSVFSIYVVQAPLGANGQLPRDAPVHSSQLSLVDLAGSERTNRTNNQGTRLREAANINTSLMKLRQCLEALRDIQANPSRASSNKPPYRDSKITHLFKAYFEGQGSVKMCLCVNPSADDTTENSHVLKFGELAQEIQVQRAAVYVAPALPEEVFESTTASSAATTSAAESESDAALGSIRFEIPVPVLHKFEIEGDPFSAEAVEESLRILSLRRESNREPLSVRIAPLLEKKLDHLAAAVRLMRNPHQEQELLALQSMNQMKDKEVAYLREKLEKKETEVGSLRVHMKATEREAASLAKEVDEKKWELNNANLEMQRQRQKLQSKFTSHVAKQTAKFESKNEKIKERFKREVRQREAVIQEVARVISSPPAAADVEMDRHGTERQSRRSYLHASSSESDIRRDTEVGPRGAAALPTPSSSSSRSPAISNPRHRRSLSQGAETGGWVDHHPQPEVPLSTVFKPRLRGKKKSVTRLDEADIAKKGKYILTHQDQDEQGGLETRLVKGEILPTATGGSQVVFQDVEVLRQQSPTADENGFATGRTRSNRSYRV